VDASLRLKPDFFPALLLRAQILHETGETSEAALNAKQCWHVLSQKSDEGTVPKAREECEGLLAQLGETPDDTLPRSFIGYAHPGMPLQTSEDSAHVMVEVSGCGSDESNGHFAPTSQLSNGRPIYENRRGVRLSLEMLRQKVGRKVRLGWVIGRRRVALYGLQTDDAVLPLQGGWRSFSGKPPVPVCRASVCSHAMFSGFAQLRSGNAMKAVFQFNTSLAHMAPLGMTQRGALLTHLARAHRLSGHVQEALLCAKEAVVVAPASSEAYIEMSRILESVGAEEAATPLQQLITMKMSTECTDMLRELSPQVPAIDRWLRRMELEMPGP